MRILTSFAAAAIVAATAPSSALAQCPNAVTGADVIVGSVSGVSNFGATGGMAGYSLGTTSCNNGDTELLWFSNGTNHPVIGQNIYRLENGRFEQLGMSWLKHGFFALQQNLCCSCISSSSGGSRLGVGCSDPYSSGLNGDQGGLGPRHQVNAFTGAYIWPYQGQNQTGDRPFKRVQIPNTEMDPSTHPTAQFFGEAQYIANDDAAAGNGTNNVSWRPLNRTGTQAQGGAWRLATTGSTRREEPAIYAWAENDPNVLVSEINVPNEGQFVAGSTVIDNNDGTYSYEYAIFNNTSDFSGQSFSVPVGTAATITNVGMSFPLYHSGEPYTNVDWTSTVSNGLVTWQTAETHAQNTDANALRWSTTYSFWFTATTPPTTKNGELGLFKPGNPGTQIFDVTGPMDVGPGGLIISNYCSTNINSTGETSKIAVSNIDLIARTMTLEASDLPPNQFGFFITSLSTGLFPNAGNSSGVLCLGGEIGRSVGGAVLNAGAAGEFFAPVDLDMVPTSNSLVSVMAGETRFFQCWHRDITGLGTQTSNFSDGLRITFP